MAKKVLQFRYYGDDSDKNFPLSATWDSFIRDENNGNIFNSGNYNVIPISQLGIQSLPGTKFYLNGAVNPIVIGVSGIYDLDIRNGARVTELCFSRQSMERIKNEINGYLIVDVLYGEEDD